MITTKLPTIKKHIDDATNQLVVEKGEITVGIDTSLFAEERWERFFPHKTKPFLRTSNVSKTRASSGAQISFPTSKRCTVLWKATKSPISNRFCKCLTSPIPSI